VDLCRVLNHVFLGLCHVLLCEGCFSWYPIQENRDFCSLRDGLTEKWLSGKGGGIYGMREELKEVVSGER
jgi:hypothetical protein